MSMTWAKPLPIDRNGAPMQNYPPPTSTLGSVYRDNAASSSVTGLNANATVVEIAASGAPIGIRWAPTSTTQVSVVTASSFDHIVMPNEVRQFVIPRKTQAIPNYSAIGSPSVVGLNTAEGLFDGIATIGAGSVFLSQY